ncbi:MAG TPA: hypothetical protein VHM26_12280 [Chitinophagaceae bacterium]|jgi:hypothetical protein|nr:hypothetical protein [Chitinophagaceae bacterium]
MNKKNLLVFLLLFCIKTQAQLLVNLQLPAIGLSSKSQLWNMAAVNTTNGSLQIKVSMLFTDVSTGQLVFTASSGQFTLTAGSHILQANDFMPVVYNIVNGNYGIDNSPGGLLPVGNFTICYQFDKIIGDNTERITEECETVEIEPISPPLLVFPEDQSILEINRPVFNWIPPAPVSLFSNLNYNLRLVEILPTQSAADAVQQNPAIFSQQNITGLATPYLSSLPALDTGKWYAWQVTANNNNTFVGRSDVWSFRITNPGIAADVSNKGQAFAKLRKEGEIHYFICNRYLNVAYDNYLPDDTVSIAIYDVTGQFTPIELDSNYLVLHPGQNLISLDVGASNSLSPNRIYQFELVNSRQEKWVGKFYFRRQDHD